VSHRRRLAELEKALPRDAEDICIQCRPGGVRAFLDAYWAKVRTGEITREDDTRPIEEQMAHLRELRSRTPPCARCGR
jgi:hypothetical protein